MQKYKALICDVDGTLIPLKRDGMPSEKVRKTIIAASNHIHVGVATSRPYHLVHHIISHLHLHGPSIISSGAQIMDCATKQVFSQHAFTLEEIQKIYGITRTFGYQLLIDYTEKFATVDDTSIFDGPVLSGVILSLPPKQADALVTALSTISTISIHKIPSWEKGTLDVSVGPLLATKQHGIEEVAKILGITTQEIIGVGDGYNDFPLLMACGLKIAMGNAVDELKAIADYIAPTQEEDGIVYVIKKYILP